MYTWKPDNLAYVYLPVEFFAPVNMNEQAQTQSDCDRVSIGLRGGEPHVTGTIVVSHVLTVVAGDKTPAWFKSVDCPAISKRCRRTWCRSVHRPQSRSLSFVDLTTVRHINIATAWSADDAFGEGY